MRRFRFDIALRGYCRPRFGRQMAIPRAPRRHERSGRSDLNEAGAASLPDDVDPVPFVSRSQSNHLAGWFVWMTPLLTVVLTLPACVALGADPGVNVMIACCSLQWDSL